jgi:hypothetical protein
VVWNEDHVTLVKRCGLDKKSRVRGIKVRRVETRGAVKGLGCEGPRKGGSFAHSRVSESRPGPASFASHGRPLWAWPGAGNANGTRPREWPQS